MHRRQLPILEPCTEDFSAMARDGDRRVCQRCRTAVHDLSAMTEAEAELLLLRSRGQTLCVRYDVRSDGTVRFAPPPPRTAGALVATLAGVMAACTSTSPAVELPPVGEISWEGDGSTTIPARDRERSSGEELAEAGGIAGGVIGGVVGTVMGGISAPEAIACVGPPPAIPPPRVRRDRARSDERSRLGRKARRKKARQERRAERRERKRQRKAARQARRQEQRQVDDARREHERQVQEAERRVRRQARRAERRQRRQERRAERERRRQERRVQRRERRAERKRRRQERRDRRRR